MTEPAPADPRSASARGLGARWPCRRARTRPVCPPTTSKPTAPLFWRFENDDVPVGFGGLEIFGDQALLRSVVTLPPVRNRGIGNAIVASLETEARIRGCRAVWLVTEKAVAFFAGLGYRACERSEAPKIAREAASFACPATAASDDEAAGLSGTWKTAPHTPPRPEDSRRLEGR